MDIRSTLNGLQSLLGVNSTDSTKLAKSTPVSTQSSETSADHATLSNAANLVANSAEDAGVRFDKVASIQAALAAGTYSVPASAVASKLVDSMLGNAS